MVLVLFLLFGLCHGLCGCYRALLELWFRVCVAFTALDVEHTVIHVNQTWSMAGHYGNVGMAYAAAI